MLLFKLQKTCTLHYRPFSSADALAPPAGARVTASTAAIAIGSGADAAFLCLGLPLVVHNSVWVG